MKKFNAKKTKNEIVQFIRKYYKKNNLKGAVIGISGGKDSGVVAGLFTEAIGAENILGITMPCHSKIEDKSDANLVSEYYGFEMINFDLTNIYDSYKKELESISIYSEEQTKNSDINLKPRLRMSTLYYFAALYSSLKQGTYIVAGTGNKCEIYVGYFTKGGDGVSDINVLADLTVDEVIAIGEVLNVPDKVLHKAPNDGLSNQTDEDKLGVKYKEIADYIENKDSVKEPSKSKIEKLHLNSLHKFNTPIYKKSNELITNKEN